MPVLYQQNRSCFMNFDNNEALKKHQDKFCINSKYANLDSLETYMESLLTKGNNKKSLNNFQISQYIKPKDSFKTDQESNNLQQQYRAILKIIASQDTNKQQMQKQRKAVQAQLQGLNKKQKQLVLEAKRLDLVQVLKRRQKLAQQQQYLQKQIKAFQQQNKNASRMKQTSLDQDFVYKQGRQAGKLAMQRRILQQKKRQIQKNLKLKKRQESKLNQQLNQINQLPIYITDYQKKQSIAKITPKQNQISKLRQTQKPSSLPISSVMQNAAMANIKQLQPKPTIIKSKVQKRNVTQPSSQAIIQNNSKKSQVKPTVQNKNQQIVQQSKFRINPANFTGYQKTLFQNINPQGKSDEDIFIQSLVAQQYDALNILARIPKNSQLYQIKLKQFQTMSRLRQQVKDRVHYVRLEKVKRQFLNQKQLTQTQKQNVKWLDQNRKKMLVQEADIFSQHHVKQAQMIKKQQQIIQNKQIGTFSPGIKSSTNINIPFNPTGSKTFNSNGQIGKRGYKISIKKLKNCQSNKPMCIRIVLLEQGQKSSPWTFSTKYHDDQAPKDDRNPFNPGIKNRRDENDIIIFNQFFEVRQDLQNFYNNRQNQLYLWIMLMEKDPQNMTIQPSVAVWYCFKLTHFGLLRQGNFNLGFYQQKFAYPVPVDMNKLKKKSGQQIEIQLGEFRIVQQVRPPSIQQLPLSKKSISSNISDSQKTAFNRPKNNKGKSMKKIQQQFFISNDEQPNMVSIKKNQPINLSITLIGVRTLPSYIGPIKLQISIITDKNQFVLQPQQFLAQIGDDMYNPSIKYNKKLQNITPSSTATLLIRFIGLSTLNYDPGMIGCCFFHLFYNQNMQQIQINSNKYNLINDFLQIPIYWSSIAQYYTSQIVKKQFAIIPCTSLLLHVGTSSPNKIPSYDQGQYNTYFFKVDDTMLKLFREQYKRQKLNTKEYVEGYYKFKGINVSKNNQPQLRKLLSQALAFNQQNTSSLFMLHAMAEYMPNFGVIYSIDAISVPKNQTQFYYFCSACLFPPAKYYKKLQNDLNFYYNINFSTSLSTKLQFTHQPTISNQQYNLNTGLVIQVYRVEVNNEGVPQSQIQNCGFAIVPLFDIQQKVNCVNVGYQQINLIQRDFDWRDVKNIQQDLSDYLNGLENKQSEFKIFLRIMNGFFPRQLIKTNTQVSGKTLKSIFKSSIGFNTSKQKIKSIIQNYFNVAIQ